MDRPSTFTPGLAGADLVDSDGNVLGNTVAAEGANYVGVPMVGDAGQLMPGAPVLMLRVGRGQVGLALGGYHPPASGETVT